MIWKITCYNGTVWEAPCQMSLEYAVEEFCNESGLSQVDIKLIENLH